MLRWKFLKDWNFNLHSVQETIYNLYIDIEVVFFHLQQATEKYINKEVLSNNFDRT